MIRDSALLIHSWKLEIDVPHQHWLQAGMALCWPLWLLARFLPDILLYNCLLDAVKKSLLVFCDEHGMLKTKIMEYLWKSTIIMEYDVIIWWYWGHALPPLSHRWNGTIPFQRWERRFSPTAEMGFHPISAVGEGWKSFHLPSTPLPPLEWDHPIYGVYPMCTVGRYQFPRSIKLTSTLPPPLHMFNTVVTAMA